MAHHERSFTCGECKHFSPTTVNNEPFGTVLIDGKEVDLGACRVNYGLIISPREATAPCIQPEGYFATRDTEHEDAWCKEASSADVYLTELPRSTSPQEFVPEESR